MLLSMDADPTENDWYGTALHCTAKAGQVGTIQALLDAGVDANLRDNHGRAPLLCAAQSVQIDAMHTLLDRGADANFSGKAWSILSDVIHPGGSQEVVRTLLCYRADPNHLAARSIPLLKATMQGDCVIMETLLDHGAQIEASGAQGWIALHLATMRGYIPLPHLLLDREAAINHQSPDGSSMIQMATKHCQVDSVKTLLQRGVNIGLTDIGGLTRLHTAAIKNQAATLQLLIDAGANVNACDADGNTALEIAFNHESWDAHKLFLSLKPEE
ncbi:MAG: hypothetical protein Q9170_007149 [Blastenia crenularia]